MAFNFLKWLFGSRDSPTEVSGTDFFDIFTDTYVRELAFQSCVNLTANAVSKCEIKTFLAGDHTTRCSDLHGAFSRVFYDWRGAGGRMAARYY